MNPELRNAITVILSEKGDNVSNSEVARDTGYSANTIRRERNEMKNEGLIK
jgi:DeoR/GlpR family transcriptional regulator of sugar metabolism